MSEPAFAAVPLSPLRAAIAARMTEAQRTIPQYHVSVDVEMDDVMALRQRVNREHSKHKVSVNDVIIKACATALMQQPELNVQWVDDSIHRYARVDISVIVAVEGGLSAPVIRGADTKSVFQISRELKDLARRATQNRLKLSDLSGGTFSISNLGMYGIDEFDDHQPTPVRHFSPLRSKAARNHQRAQGASCSPDARNIVAGSACNRRSEWGSVPA